VAGGISAFPLSGRGSDGGFVVLNNPDEVAGLPTFEEVMARPELLQRVMSMFQDPARAGQAQYRLATAGYFRAMGIPLVRGRLFDERDTPDAPHVAVISQSLADQRWPGEDPIGKFIEYGNMDGDLAPFTIVGIVGDVRERSLETEPEATFYGNAAQRPGPTDYTFVVRADGPASAIGAAARGAVQELSPDVAVRVRSLEEIFSASLAERRFALVLLAAFGVTALLIAWTGIYGVVSFLMSQRRREMGIRMAMGARPGDVLRLVLGESASLVLAGLAVGLLVALGVTRLLAGMLHGVGIIDPVVFAGVALTIVMAGMLAGFFPARSATRIDPAISLQSE
jgi:predicted permease